MKYKVYVLVLIILSNLLIPCFSYAETIPESIIVDGKTYKLNTHYWEESDPRYQVYGSYKDIPESKNNYDEKTKQYRYIGYALNGGYFSNKNFPDDYPKVPFDDANWIFKPWTNITVRTVFNIIKSPWDDEISSIAWMELMDERINGGTVYGYAHVQTPPRTFNNGSVRLFHNDNGHYKYRTIKVDKLTEEIVEDTDFLVDCEITSNDFTIEEDESSVAIDVKVSGLLEDESYFGDDIEMVKHYTREDITDWYIKLEYADKSEYVRLPSNGTNEAEHTFTANINRGDVEDGDKIVFDGIVRVVFANGKYYKDLDTDSCTITVETANTILPPELMITAQPTANILEEYSIKCIPYVPQGESVSSLTLEANMNGNGWVNITLVGNEATDSYSSEGVVQYRGEVVLSNGLKQTATATTEIADNRAASATAEIDIPDYTYEGHWVTAVNESEFIFGGTIYDPEQAYDLGLGRSHFKFYDDSEYRLDRDLYDTKDKEQRWIDVKFNSVGDYKVGVQAKPKNGNKVEDVKGIEVLRTPDMTANIVGTKKQNRKLTAYAKIMQNPDYPIDKDKLYIEIEDLVTNDVARITKDSNSNTSMIKTLDMRIYDNEYDIVMEVDFLTKNSTYRDYRATLYAEDNRGQNDLMDIKFTVVPDVAPVATIRAADVSYRENNGICNLKIIKDGKSSDNDFFMVNNLRYKIDTDNDNDFSDEEFVDFSQSLIEREVFLSREAVGKILLDYEVKENVLPTIPQYINENDYLSHRVQKIVDVGNLSPHTALRAIRNERVDILALGTSEVDTGKIIQTIEGIDTDIMINTRADNGIVTTATEPIEFLTRTTYPHKLYGVFTSTDETAMIETSGNTYVFIRYDGPSIVNSFSKSTYTDYQVKEYEQDGKTIRRLFAFKNKSLVEIDLNTGSEILNVDLGLASNSYAAIKGVELFGDKIAVIGSKYNGSYSKNMLYFEIEQDGTISRSLDFRDTYWEQGGILGRNDEYVYYYETTHSDGVKLYRIKDDEKTHFRTLSDRFTPPDNWREYGANLRIFGKHDGQLYFGITHKFKRNGSRGEYGWQSMLYKFNPETEDIVERVVESSPLYDGDVYSIVANAELINLDETGITLIKKKWNSNRSKELQKYDLDFNLIYYFSPSLFWNNHWIYDKRKEGDVIIFLTQTSSANGRAYLEYSKYNAETGSLINAQELVDTSNEYSVGFGISYNLLPNSKYLTTWQERWGSPTVFNTYTDVNTYIGRNGPTKFDYIVQIDSNRVYCRRTSGPEYIYYDDERKFESVSYSFGAIDRVFVAPNSKYMLFSLDFSYETRIGSYKINKGFVAECVEAMEKFKYRESSTRYIPIITKEAIDLKDKDIEYLVNKAHEYNVEIIFLGGEDNREVGIKIAEGTGGSFYNYTDMSGVYAIIKNHVALNLPTKQSLYTKKVNIGDIVEYERFYSDPEGDSFIDTSIIWHFIREGVSSWSSPSEKTIFSEGEEGVYYISWDVLDNPPPADTQNTFSSYRKHAVRQEMKLVVGEDIPVIPEPPAPEVEINPSINIKIGGVLKVNRKVDFDIELVPGTRFLDNSTLSIGIDDSQYMLPKELDKLSFSKIFKKDDVYTITVSIDDIDGQTYTASKDFTVIPDEDITLDLEVTPIKNYRDGEGRAVFHVKAAANSVDDYIKSLKYYIIYDVNNNCSFDDDPVKELVDFESITEFDLSVDTGVGKYQIRAEAIEGFLEPTIDSLITGLDIHRKLAKVDILIDNYTPFVDIGLNKKVYLIDEEMTYISNIDKTNLNGHIEKSYHDIDNDTLDEIRIKYIQDRTFMPNEDGESIHHNKTYENFVSSLDKAGEYTIETSVIDSPKPLDIRFDEYKKESEICTSKVIVHRRPIARLDFSFRHATANNFKFGNNIYLDGTEIIINDDSSDPDGFEVTTKIEYKTTNNRYTTIDDGDRMTLNYGDVYTFRVTTKDNWGASDVNVYSFEVLNSLDMSPMILPNPVPASEDVVLRLETNQYATSARAIIQGEEVSLQLAESDIYYRVWEGQYTLDKRVVDHEYTSIFYATSEGLGELEKAVQYKVNTPIDIDGSINGRGDNAVLVLDRSNNISATTSAYTESVKVNILGSTLYLNEVGSNGEKKLWQVDYSPDINAGEISDVASFHATTYNGNSDYDTVDFVTKIPLSVSAVIKPTPALAGDELIIDIRTEGNANRLILSFDNDIYDSDKRNKYQYPVEINIDEAIDINQTIFSYITSVDIPKTIDKDDNRLRSSYRIDVTAYNDYNSVSTSVRFDIKGSVLDLIKPGIKSINKD